MKKMIVNIMATTGITLVILALVATWYGGTLICISTVFQALVSCRISVNDDSYI